MESCAAVLTAACSRSKHTSSGGKNAVENEVEVSEVEIFEFGGAKFATAAQLVAAQAMRRSLTVCSAKPRLN